MFEPITRALLAAATVGPGQTVLDVAAGPGEPSLAISEVVGRGGRVFSTDAVAGMVAAARREARSLNRTNVEFCQCAAGALPFRSDAFDAIVCRLGVMFFPDPPASLGEMLRVSKPGGRVALAVWPAQDLNPFIRIPTAVVARHCGAAAEDPDAPGALRFAEPGKLARLLEQAGARAVRETRVDFRMTAPVRLEEFWPIRAELSETLRSKIAGLPAPLVTRIAEDVTEAARPFFPGDRMNFPAQVLVVSGEK
jgi:SAM-dependent methyltransferase